jgi:hypothetical protein
MSETIRSYSPPRRNSYDAPVSGGGMTRNVVILLTVLLFFWLIWTTRDNWPMERLVPGDQTFHLRAQDLLDTRREAADSTFWSLGMLPEKYRDIPKWLNNDFGLPQWVLNNLVTDVCYVSGTDLANFSDLLVVTRMSRIGCLLERYYGIADDVEVEYAGGLELRRMGVDPVTYYAVRGRTLVFSPSREALIRALTLTEDGGVVTLEETVAPMAGDLQGRINFGENQSLGVYLEQSDFGLRFEPDAIVFSSRSTVTPAWKAQLDRIVAGQRTGDLMVPAQGSLVLAGDLNTPLPQLWTSVDEMTGGALTGYWSSLPWVRGDGAAGSAWAAMLESMKGGIDSGFSMRWSGFDYNGIVPVPEAELFLETKAGFAPKLAESVPALPEGQAPTDFVPYRIAESGVIRCPTGWGNVFEPTVFAENTGIRITLHPQHMEHALAMDKSREPAPGDGLLYMRIRPIELIELLHEGGMPYAHSGLLRGQTAESFDAAMEQALAGSRQISEVRVTVGYEDGALNLEAVLLLAGESVQENAETQEAPSTASE